MGVRFPISLNKAALQYLVISCVTSKYPKAPVNILYIISAKQSVRVLIPNPYHTACFLYIISLYHHHDPSANIGNRTNKTYL